MPGFPILTLRHSQKLALKINAVPCQPVLLTTTQTGVNCDF